MLQAQIFKMKFTQFKLLLPKILLLIISQQNFFYTQEVKSAEEIKIIYSIFSRTVKVESLKTFANEGYTTRTLRRILRATGTPDNEIRLILNKDFEVPITIASKLVYSEMVAGKFYTLIICLKIKFSNWVKISKSGNHIMDGLAEHLISSGSVAP